MDLTNQLNLNEIPEPHRSTILAALTEIVLSKLAMTAYDRLSAEDKAYLDGLDENSINSDEILDFLRTRLPDLDSTIAKIIADEQTELTDKTNQLMKLLQSQKPHEAVDNGN